MTDKEKAIVTAYTGVTMLEGEKFSIFHKYIEDLLGRPIWTHELATEAVWNEIKEKSKPDFLELCADEPVKDKSKGCFIDDYEAIANMTDAQAADILEKVFNWSLAGRKTGKTLFSLSVLVALKRASNALRRGEYETGT